MSAQTDVLAAQLNGAMDCYAALLAYVEVVLKPTDKGFERHRRKFFAASEQVQRVLSGPNEYGPGAPGFPEAAEMLGADQ